MVRATKAAIACDSVFLRDIVSENLQQRGIEILAASSSFLELPENCYPDVMVVIETAPNALIGPDANVNALANRFSR